jgi:Family of unknown function (DUF6085)
MTLERLRELVREGTHVCPPPISSLAPVAPAFVLPRVKGRCPMGCGETLFLGIGGFVTCSYVHCPNPGAASDQLEHQALRSGATQKEKR